MIRILNRFYIFLLYLLNILFIFLIQINSLNDFLSLTFIAAIFQMDRSDFLTHSIMAVIKQ